MPPRRSDYGPIQLADRLGLRAWQVDRAQTLGLIPAPDVDGRRWSAALVEPLADRVPEIVAAVGEHPGVGANRAAEQLGWRLAEFERVVAERGLRPGRFGRYLAADVEALGQDLELAEQVAAERLLGPDQAAGHLEIIGVCAGSCLMPWAA